tara:strand:+ start:6735 stop:7052 length:318 start_codon:yes stop_codon:yes gene_type:complete
MNIFVMILSAFLLEYFILLRLYRRTPSLEKISLIIAPLMMVTAYYLFKNVLKREPTLAEFFLVVALLELPLSAKGYQLTPDAAIWERVLVAGSFGTVIYSFSKVI